MKFCKLSLFLTSDNSYLWDIVCLKYQFFAGDPLQGTVFVKLQLSCASHVELSYYSTSASIGRKDICCHCGVEGAEQDREAAEQYRTVIPFVLNVKHQGRKLLRELRKSENKYQTVKSLLINCMFLTVLCFIITVVNLPESNCNFLTFPCKR